MSPAVDIRGRVLAREVAAGAPVSDDDLAP
jgi:N-acetylneuraminate synthase/N,N'-diacetyllegionaminate synthase